MIKSTNHYALIVLWIFRSIQLIKDEDGYKLKVQTPETKTLFGSAKKLFDKTKN